MVDGGEGGALSSLDSVAVWGVVLLWGSVVCLQPGASVTSLPASRPTSLIR